MNAKVLPYHWDDRQKLYNDYKYLSNLYEVTLQGLTKQLNQIHSTNHSLRYWRIIIGPWLGYFLQVLFDRWSMLKSAFENYEISSCKVLLNENSSFIANDFKHSDDLWIRDKWNEEIYKQLLQENWQNNLELDFVKTNNNRIQKIDDKSRMRSFLAIWRKKFNKYKQLLDDSEKYFFIKTYLPSYIEDDLLIRLGQRPKSWKTLQMPKFKINMAMRDWSINNTNESDEFANIAVRMIPQQIPKTYLEGYNLLLELTSRLNWPKYPEVIFNSNGIQSSFDILKVWTAEQIRRGAKLVVGQHGGNYGIGSFSFSEDHEIAISNCYLSWGWKDKNEPKVQPVGQIKRTMPLEVNEKENNRILLVTNANPRYSNNLFSCTLSSQWLDYLDDQFKFVEKLSEDLQDLLTIRLYTHDYGWEQEKRWKGQYPDLYIDNGKTDIYKLMSKTRLYVSTYNALTYLESFAMDIPTVIFWNPKHWEIRDSALPYFNKLKQVNIFHETPESAALHVREVWDDVYGWWKSKALRKVLDEFKSKYCDVSCDLTDNIEKVLLEHSSNN